MEEREFKWGDEVEVRDRDGHKWVSAIFGCLNPEGNNDYKFFAPCKEGVLWQQCRHRRPNLKPGDPVVVFIGGVAVKRHFKKWPENGIGIICYA